MPNKYDNQHIKNVHKYAADVSRLYDEAIQAAARLLVGVDYDPAGFEFTKYPAAKQKFEKFFNSFNRNLGGTIRNGMREEWKLSNGKNDTLVKHLVGNNPDKRYLQGNEDALQSFIGRQRDGLKLSDRVWNLTKEFKDKLEEGLRSGIGNGQGAVLQAKDLMEYLNQQQGNNPGTGVYRDPRKNAQRLTRTETNMAYHEADWERWQQMDFVIGFEVEISNNGHACPICIQLQGKYPKWFKFRSWHPQCYSDDTEVYTDHGWKLFADVTMDDQILSLNPETKNLEWAGILEQVKYHHVGEMIQFHNRSLDLLVTPDHPMKYLTGRGQWMEKPASEFKGGILYRSSEYKGKSPDHFQIGSKKIPFTLYCQFMGYYLADGSIAQKKKSQVHIAQRPDNDTLNWAIMGDILHDLPYKVCQVQSGFYIFDQELHDYLLQFGKAPDKFIPEAIKNASVEHIQLFLDAFISCDGHIRQPKSFVGSRGNVFTGKNLEKQYYSTSKQLAGDIGELILKVGKRPSFSVDKIKGKQQQFKNGTYTINSDMVRINELNSQTATVFNKDTIHYHGFVYDLELDRNHLMYVRRNGKCLWGSNCMCHATAILADDIDNIENDHNEVKTVPAGFAKWVTDNEERSKGKPQPYFVRDNFKGGKVTGGLLKPESMPAVKAVKEAGKHVPAELSKYQKELGVKINTDIFVHLKDPVPLQTTDNRGAYFNASGKFVNIPIDERRRNSKWWSEAVVYHEYGHAIDNQNKLYEHPIIVNGMEDLAKKLSMAKLDAGYFKSKIGLLKRYHSGENVFDQMEQVGSIGDTIMALNTAYGEGHSKQYFKIPNNRQKEFIAHMFENKFIGNPLFKEIAPDLYNEMLAMFDKLF